LTIFNLYFFLLIIFLVFFYLIELCSNCHFIFTYCLSHIFCIYVFSLKFHSCFQRSRWCSFDPCTGTSHSCNRREGRLFCLVSNGGTSQLPFVPVPRWLPSRHPFWRWTMRCIPWDQGSINLSYLHMRHRNLREEDAKLWHYYYCYATSFLIKGLNRCLYILDTPCEATPSSDLSCTVSYDCLLKLFVIFIFSLYIL